MPQAHAVAHLVDLGLAVEATAQVELDAHPAPARALDAVDVPEHGIVGELVRHVDAEGVHARLELAGLDDHLLEVAAERRGEVDQLVLGEVRRRVDAVLAGHHPGLDVVEEAPLDVGAAKHLEAIEGPRPALGALQGLGALHDGRHAVPDLLGDRGVTLEAGGERDVEVDAGRGRQVDAAGVLEVRTDVLAGEELLVGVAAGDQVEGLKGAGAGAVEGRAADVRVGGEQLAGHRVGAELRDAEEGRAGLVDVAEEVEADVTALLALEAVGRATVLSDRDGVAAVHADLDDALGALHAGVDPAGEVRLRERGVVEVGLEGAVGVARDDVAVVGVDDVAGEGLGGGLEGVVDAVAGGVEDDVVAGAARAIGTRAALAEAIAGRIVGLAVDAGVHRGAAALAHADRVHEHHVPLRADLEGGPDEVGRKLAAGVPHHPADAAVGVGDGVARLVHPVDPDVVPEDRLVAEVRQAEGRIGRVRRAIVGVALEAEVAGTVEERVVVVRGHVLAPVADAEEGGADRGEDRRALGGAREESVVTAEGPDGRPELLGDEVDGVELAARVRRARAVVVERPKAIVLAAGLGGVVRAVAAHVGELRAPVLGELRDVLDEGVRGLAADRAEDLAGLRRRAVPAGEQVAGPVDPHEAALPPAAVDRVLHDLIELLAGGRVVGAADVEVAEDAVGRDRLAEEALFRLAVGVGRVANGLVVAEGVEDLLVDHPADADHGVAARGAVRGDLADEAEAGGVVVEVDDLLGHVPGALEHVLLDHVRAHRGEGRARVTAAAEAGAGSEEAGEGAEESERSSGAGGLQGRGNSGTLHRSILRLGIVQPHRESLEVVGAAQKAAMGREPAAGPGRSESSSSSASSPRMSRRSSSSREARPWRRRWRSSGVRPSSSAPAVRVS